MQIRHGLSLLRDIDRDRGNHADHTSEHSLARPRCCPHTHASPTISTRPNRSSRARRNRHLSEAATLTLTHSHTLAGQQLLHTHTHTAERSQRRWLLLFRCVCVCVFASQKISPFNRSIGSDVLIFSLGRFRNERQTIGSSRRRRRVFLDVLRTRRLTYFFFPFQRRPRRPKQAHERYTLKKNGHTAAITSPRWLCISPSIFKHGSRRRGGAEKIQNRLPERDGRKTSEKRERDENGKKTE